MQKRLLISLGLVLLTTAGYAQPDKFWSVNDDLKSEIKTDKAVSRRSFPDKFILFNLNATSLRQKLFTVAGNSNNAVSSKTVISLPNADGNLESFEIFESSNFEPDLQARFPEIRAYSGKGITDPHATLKLSISPQGIQTMVFRTDTDNEFIEPYSKDHTVYAVYRSQRSKGSLPWTCSTDDQNMANNFTSRTTNTTNTSDAAGTSTGQLKTMRLAQSCNGEYANYFGATSSAQVGLVLAAFNATLSRCNGIYEKDLALHLNLISNTTSVIYYNPATDPYTTLGSWNLQLQQTLTSVIGNAAYDIGHMFGASGGGGNAGCIGCVCVNPASSSSKAKGSGITSPADGVPMGDNFDIDYVAHEVGHQLGANHTFSMSLEGSGQNKEVGSGITIMGYAGITAQDVAPHSIDIFHETSIAQITANLATKTCPVTTNISANNTAPVIAALSNYTIPISTPFALTGEATDVNGDALTYCWEQNDNSSLSGTMSVASPTKAAGPNWLSFRPTISGTRFFPKLSTILSGLNVTPVIAGGDAGTNIEALSSVSRTLNFRLTVRDNHPYSSVAPVAVGQTAFSDVVVTVTNTSGPFQVTSPNTNIIWNAGGNATVTWSVNGTTNAPVNCSSVNILLSTDGGITFNTVLASGTTNDGSEVIAVPVDQSSTCRVKVEAAGNIFFDISNSNFSIGAPALCGSPAGLNATGITTTDATLNWNAVTDALSYDVDYKATSTSTWINAASATTATSVSLTGLTSGVAYDWRVRATCAAGTGSYTQAQFTTTSTSSPCPGIYDVSSNGTTNGAATIPLNTEVKGLINVKGDIDNYRFTITNDGTISISLTNLAADYQLALINSTGTTIQSSVNAGTANETINRSVTAGTYYARVYPRNNGSTNASICYSLNVQTGTASRNSGNEIVQSISTPGLSPNPAGYSVNLDFEVISSGDATITVIDQAGATLSAKTIAVNAGKNTRRLDVGKLASGMYFIKIQSGSVIQMAKLIINK